MLVYESKVIACQIYAVFPLRPADQSTLGSTAHSLSFLQRRGGGGRGGGLQQTAVEIPE